jgi:UrcA family protein
MTQDVTTNPASRAERPRTPRLRTRAVATSILIVAGLGLTAFRAEARKPTPTSVTVSFADLDLTDRAGRAALHARVGKAAKEVCKINARDQQVWCVQAVRLRVAPQLRRAFAQAETRRQMTLLATRG